MISGSLVVPARPEPSVGVQASPSASAIQHSDQCAAPSCSGMLSTAVPFAVLKAATACAPK